MPAYADLEISLHPRAPGAFAVEFRYTPPESEAEGRPASGQRPVLI